MSGECDKCSEHCLDCKCRKQNASGPLVFFDEDKRTEWEEIDHVIPRNKQSLLEILRYIREGLREDEEIQHVYADKALLKYIDDPDITKAFEDIDKWYA